MKAEVVETALALLLLTLLYCMWYSLAEERDAERFYIIGAVGATMLCTFGFFFCALWCNFIHPLEIYKLSNGKAERAPFLYF